MELKQLWAVVARRWWLILLPGLIALVLSISAVRAMIRPPETYSVTLRFTASQRPTGPTIDNFQDKSYTVWLASEYVVNNLASWMRTQSFAEEISKSLSAQNVNIEAGALAGAVSSDSARSIMTLQITWPDPDQIKAIAAAAVDVLQHQNQVYWPELGAQPAEIKQLDAIQVVSVATPITTRLAPLARVGVGLLAGTALAFLAEYLDPRLRNRTEVEALGFGVLTEIPR